MPGLKHLIECHCTLAIFKNNNEMINHKFPVYSKFDSSGRIIRKVVKCNNCDMLHEVYDVCKSEIRPGKDSTQITISKEDISFMLPDKVVNLLTKTEVDISVWEHVLDVIEEERWGEVIVLKRDIVDELTNVKAVIFESETKFKIFSETINDLIRGEWWVM